ncbi:hypothetical protein [Microcoleus sp. K4-B3]|uniref:hypothetical protein n=2 Tax=unclassified Microcoleus TaxID=2642155 RepID=UPI002FD3C4EE
MEQSTASGPAARRSRSEQVSPANLQLIYHYILSKVATKIHPDMKPKPNSTEQSAQHRLLKKLPEVTIFFWIIKLLTTGMGETTSDYLAHQMNPIFAVALGGSGLVIALLIQFLVRKYISWVYWLAIIMVAIFGTMAADAIHVVLGVSYLLSTVGFSVVLSIIFAVWYMSEKTLSINHIYTLRRELFYWATVMVTFALGTAAGDMTASTWGLGYFTSGVLFALLFALPAFAYWRSGLNEVGAFWLAYILTRPLGASFADWIGKSQDVGGVGFGTGRISIVLAILIFGFVAYETYSSKDSYSN